MPCLFSFDAEWHNFLLPQTALSWFLISRLNHLWVTQVKMQKKQNTNLVFSKPYGHTQNRSCEWVPGLLTHIPMSATPELVAYVPKNKRLSFGRFPTPAFILVLFSHFLSHLQMLEKQNSITKCSCMYEMEKSAVLHAVWCGGSVNICFSLLTKFKWITLANAKGLLWPNFPSWRI